MWHQRSSLCLDRRILFSSSGRETGCDFGGVSSFLWSVQKVKKRKPRGKRDTAASALLKALTRRHRTTKSANSDRFWLMTCRRLPPLLPRRRSKPRSSSGADVWPGVPLGKDEMSAFFFSLYVNQVTGERKNTNLFCFSSSHVQLSVLPWLGISCQVFRPVWIASPCCVTWPREWWGLHKI